MAVLNPEAKKSDNKKTRPPVIRKVTRKVIKPRHSGTWKIDISLPPQDIIPTKYGYSRHHDEIRTD